jgi:DNA-binding LytR/AlgR family response regulator
VLLDIEMPGLDGFGVVEALRDPPAIVFVTAYDQYAIRAFEVHALDYLLKPFSRERLAQAIHRAQEGGRSQDLAAKLRPLLVDLAAEGRYLTRLAVRDRDCIRVLDVGDVDWIGIEDEQVMVHAGDRAYRVRRTLADLQLSLDPERFFRAHRSAIVNLDRVQEIVPWFKGGYILRLSTGAEVDLSRAQARALRKTLDWCLLQVQSAVRRDGKIGTGSQPLWRAFGGMPASAIIEQVRSRKGLGRRLHGGRAKAAKAARHRNVCTTHLVASRQSGSPARNFTLTATSDTIRSDAAQPAQIDGHSALGYPVVRIQRWEKTQ